MLEVGIVGLPNIGKSTLFNAITRSKKAEAANYPFCTIDPNKAIVEIPDSRLNDLSQLSQSLKTIPTTLEFVDIAGLVQGASEGAGLGNQFLSHIRNVDAIIHIVRCFQDENIIHELGDVNPLRDIDIIQSELILSDLTSLEKRRNSREKKAKSGDKEAKEEVALLEKMIPELDKGNPFNKEKLSNREQIILSSFHLLSDKPTLLACNVSEEELISSVKNPSSHNLIAQIIEEKNSSDLKINIICSKLEEELADLSLEEGKEYLSDLGIKDSGCNQLIRSMYELLELRTYFTTGEKETRAWTITAKDKSPQAASKIHSDIERGFIAAEVISFSDFVKHKSKNGAKEAGVLRIEGKDYEVQDGDVIEFRFNI